MATNLRTIFGKARQSINDATMRAGSQLKAGLLGAQFIYYILFRDV